MESGDSDFGGRQEQSDQFCPCQPRKAAARQYSVRDASVSCTRQLVLVFLKEFSSSASYRTTFSHLYLSCFALDKTRFV